MKLYFLLWLVFACCLFVEGTGQYTPFGTPPHGKRNGDKTWYKNTIGGRQQNPEQAEVTDEFKRLFKEFTIDETTNLLQRIQVIKKYLNDDPILEAEDDYQFRSDSDPGPYFVNKRFF